jgi:membrane protease YdiL (CAAX protease family)
VYGWVAQRTGTIRYTIVAHIVLNAMGLTFALSLLGR